MKMKVGQMKDILEKLKLNKRTVIILLLIKDLGKKFYLYIYQSNEEKL